MFKLPLHSRRLFAHDTHPELPLDPDVVRPGAYKWPVHFTPSLILVVFIGGCLGAAVRYGLSLQLPTPEYGWPLGTFFVNLLGAFLLGLLLEGLTRLGEDAGARRVVRLGVGTGFMGAFTTYSTFAVEVDLLLQHNHLVLAGCYAAASIIGGIMVSALGIQAAAAHHKHRERTR